MEQARAPRGWMREAARVAALEVAAALVAWAFGDRTDALRRLLLRRARVTRTAGRGMAPAMDSDGVR